MCLKRSLFIRKISTDGLGVGERIQSAAYSGGLAARPSGLAARPSGLTARPSGLRSHSTGKEKKAEAKDASTFQTIPFSGLQTHYFTRTFLPFIM